MLLSRIFQIFSLYYRYKLIGSGKLWLPLYQTNINLRTITQYSHCKRELISLGSNLRKLVFECRLYTEDITIRKQIAQNIQVME